MSEGLRSDRDNERSLTVAGTTPAVTPNPAPVRRLKVATYEDPYASLRRQLIRIGLIFVAPVVSILAIVLIVFWVLTSSFGVTVVPASETTAGQVVSKLPEVPLPSGLRPLNRATNFDNTQLANSLVNTWIPFYDVTTLGTEIFNTGKSLNDIVAFYDEQLVKNNRWQLYKRSQFKEHTYLFYTRGTSNPRVVDGIFIDIEALLESNYNKRGGLLDSQAKIGDNIIILFKQRLIQQT
jgi:hypothetical protein